MYTRVSVSISDVCLRSEDTDVTHDGLFSDPALPKGLTCGFCRRVFERAEELQEHIHMHIYQHEAALSLLLPLDARTRPGLLGTVPPSRFQCAQCPASFTLKSNMDRHEKTIHFNCKKMQCPSCTKLFRDKTDLTWHLVSVHSIERAFVCLLCGKGLGTQKNLARHAKVCCPAAVCAGPCF